ncbi:MAG: GMC family oxidoreductase [Candidatus Acidiferrales bacterium]
MPATFDLSDSSVVVIIGSGAGGGTLANELAQKGVSVVVLEAGKRIEISDFKNDEIAMFNLFSWFDPRTTSGNWSVAKTSPDLPVWTCKLVGGTTVHWAGCALRFQEHEFKTRTRYGDIAGANLMDWPIGLQELAPYYDRAEIKMGVSGTHGMPSLPTNNNGKVLVAGAKKLGYTKYQATKMAINSVPHAGRAGCQQAGFCVQGCTFGAKWSTLYTEIPYAEATGKCEVRSESQVLRIEHDASGKVSGVVYADRTGAMQRQKARAVALAANSIESPRLLLNSSSSQFPQGLANSSGQVGCNYMRHTSGAVFAIFDKPVHFYRGTTQSSIVMDEARLDPKRGFVGGYNLELLAQGLPSFALNLAPGAWGRERASAIDNYANIAGLWILGEDLARATNRITLHAEKKDKFGMPIPNVHSDDHPNDITLRDHGYAQAEALYKSVGAKRTVRVPPFPASHNMGTNRMSEKPRDGVVNRFGRAHDIPNLFVSDGSQLTSSGAENPTLTIVALAIRQAEYIADQLAKRSI